MNAPARRPNGTLLPGQAALNPGGRPRGTTAEAQVTKQGNSDSRDGRGPRAPRPPGGRQRAGRAVPGLAPPFAGRGRAGGARRGRAGGAMPCRLIAAPFLRHDGRPQEARAAVVIIAIVVTIAVIAAAVLALLFGIWW